MIHIRQAIVFFTMGICLSHNNVSQIVLSSVLVYWHINLLDCLKAEVRSLQTHLIFFESPKQRSDLYSYASHFRFFSQFPPHRIYPLQSRRVDMATN